MTDEMGHYFPTADEAGLDADALGSEYGPCQCGTTHSEFEANPQPCPLGTQHVHTGTPAVIPRPQPGPDYLPF